MKKFGYRKSRNGCHLCKKRRVKCDEKRPCSACERHGVTCSLVDPGSAEDPASPQSSYTPRSTSASTSRALRSTASSPFTGPETPKPSLLPAPPSKPSPAPIAFEDVALNVSFLQAPSPASASHPPHPDYDQSALIDLELMHHYTLYTYNQFPHVSIRPAFFRENVPRLAVRHGFLLHQILAISAFHMLHLTPDLPSEYLDRATHHLAESLSSIRDALSGKMTLESGSALFVASSLLLPSTYASRWLLPANTTTSNPIDDIVGIVALYRGTGTVQAQASKQLSRDLFQEVFGFPPQRPPEILPWVSEYSNQLQALKAYVSSLGDMASTKQEVLTTGIQQLIDAAWAFRGGDKAVVTIVEVRVLYRWSYAVEEEFLQLLREREPAALAAIMFYAAVMRRAERHYWFLAGWGSKLVEAAMKHLEGTPWRHYTQWVFQVLAEEQSSP